MMNRVITCFFNTYPDPQRDYCWPADPMLLAGLFDTVAHDELVVLHDCFDELELPVENHASVSVWPAQQQRWHCYYDYLRGHVCDFVWLVDSTDVRCLNDPWQLKPGALYMGSVSYETLDIPWVQEHSPTADPQWLADNRDRMLLNPGMVGGDYCAVLWFCHQMLVRWAYSVVEDQCEETVYANMIGYDYSNLVTADVCTEFRKWETSHPTAIWAHK